MLALEQVCRLTGVRRVELVGWIEERWVLPDRDGEDWRFTEVDLARVRLILELRRDLRIEPETVPVVLSLLDQVYALRRTLREVCGAVQGLPESARQLLEERLAELDGDRRASG